VTENVSKFVGTFDPQHAAMVDGGPQNVTWTCPLIAKVDLHKVVLGTQRRAAEEVDITLSALPDGMLQFTMSPHSGDSFRMRRILERAIED